MSPEAVTGAGEDSNARPSLMFSVTDGYTASGRVLKGVAGLKCPYRAILFACPCLYVCIDLQRSTPRSR